MKKSALITGITGQDGSYLAEFLLEKGYEVHGIKRRASLFNTQRIDHIYQDPHADDQRFVLHYGDLTDSSNLTRIVQEVQPDEVYNLGATGRQHSVRDFVRMSAQHLGVMLRFEGEGLDEVGVVERVEGPEAPALEPGAVIVRVDPRYFRPAEVETLLGDPTKAREKLGWTPLITLDEMCAEMVAEDLNLAKRCALLQQCGFTIPTPRE